jgi:hypothetical protein
MKPNSFHQSDTGVMGNLKLVGQMSITRNPTGQNNNPFHRAFGDSSTLMGRNLRKINGRIL